jgi:hypothetical protein
MAMKKKTFMAAIAVTAVLISLVAMQFVELAKAQSSGSIFINPDGSITTME